MAAGPRRQRQARLLSCQARGPVSCTASGIWPRRRRRASRSCSRGGCFPPRPGRAAALRSGASSASSPVAILMTLTAAPITSAGRFSPRGPLGIAIGLKETIIDRYPILEAGNHGLLLGGTQGQAHLTALEHIQLLLKGLPSPPPVLSQ